MDPDLSQRLAGLTPVDDPFNLYQTPVPVLTSGQQFVPLPQGLPGYDAIDADDKIYDPFSYFNGAEVTQPPLPLSQSKERLPPVHDRDESHRQEQVYMDLRFKFSRPVSKEDGRPIANMVEPLARISTLSDGLQEQNVRLHPALISRISSPVPSISSLASSHASDVLYCSCCDRTYTGKYRRGNLSRHMRWQHGTNGTHEYPCGACDRVFQRQDARLKHQRKRHPEFVLPGTRASQDVIAPLSQYQGGIWPDGGKGLMVGKDDMTEIPPTEPATDSSGCLLDVESTKSQQRDQKLPSPFGQTDWVFDVEYRPQSPGLDRTYVKATSPLSPTPQASRVLHPSVSTLSSRSQRKVNRRNSQPT